MRKFDGGSAVDTTDRGNLRLRIWHSTGEAVYRDLPPEEVDALRKALTPPDEEAAPSSRRKKTGKEN